MAQGPNYGLQGGSVWAVSDEGTLTIASGGSINVESGGIINVAAGGSIRNSGGLALGNNVTIPGTVSIGGTAGRWAFGSMPLTSGTAIVITGLTQVVAASVTPVTAGINAGTGAGTATSFQIDLSRADTGTVFALGLTGTAAFTGAGTIVWQAMGV